MTETTNATENIQYIADFYYDKNNFTESIVKVNPCKSEYITNDNYYKVIHNFDINYVKDGKVDLIGYFDRQSCETLYHMHNSEKYINRIKKWYIDGKYKTKKDKIIKDNMITRGIYKGIPKIKSPIDTNNMNLATKLEKICSEYLSKDIPEEKEIINYIQNKIIVLQRTNHDDDFVLIEKQFNNEINLIYTTKQFMSVHPHFKNNEYKEITESPDISYYYENNEDEIYCINDFWRNPTDQDNNYTIYLNVPYVPIPCKT